MLKTLFDSRLRLGFRIANLFMADDLRWYLDRIHNELGIILAEDKMLKSALGNDAGLRDYQERTIKKCLKEIEILRDKEG